MEASQPTDEELIRFEHVLGALESRALEHAQGQNAKKTAYRVAHYVIGVLAAVSAGAAAIGALEGVSATLVAIFAGVAGVLSTLQLFLLQAGESGAFQAAKQIDYDELATDIHDFRMFELEKVPRADARKRLNEFRDRFYEMKRRGRPAE